jgi:hypothetical protein
MPGPRPWRRAWRVARSTLLLTAALFAWAGAIVAQDGPPPVQPIGRPALPGEIAAWDIDIEPDGTGLPAGEGTVARGRELYAQRCVLCHGPTGTEVPGDTLLVPRIADFWCCATTLYDFIYRTMPFYQPQSLEPDEVYSLVALLLHWNDIVPEDFVASGESVPRVVMPAADAYSMNPYTSSAVPQEGDPWAEPTPEPSR